MTKHITERDSDDKNKFLETEEDLSHFDQLPSHTKAQIFTHFLFKDFLWKFRRLFYFRKSEFSADSNRVEFGTLMKEIRNKRKEKKDRN